MLENGLGIRANPSWARFYYDLAAQAGHAQAREGLRRLGR
jgi:TPR repeat protein